MPAISADDVNRALSGCKYKEIAPSLATVISEKINQMTPCRNEAAMFLAQLIHESGGFQHREEDPTMRRNRDYGEYYGRGFIQLTWKSNYEAAGKALYGNEKYFYSEENRAKIVQDPAVAMDVSVWFWMEIVRPAGGPTENNFGLTTKAINGGLEKNSNDPVAVKRYDLYKTIAGLFGVRNVAINRYGDVGGDDDVNSVVNQDHHSSQRPAPSESWWTFGGHVLRGVAGALSLFVHGGDGEPCPCIWCNNDF